MPDPTPQNRLTMEDVAIRHFQRRDVARRRKRERLGWKPGDRHQRWAAASRDMALVFFGLAGFFLAIVLNAGAATATGFDWGVIGLLVVLGLLELRDGRRGPPIREGVPPWALERDGPEAVAEYEAKLRAEREAGA